MSHPMLIEADELLEISDLILFDCRFSLMDPEAGQAAYTQGHIPGAYFLDLNRDLSGPLAVHGGRHPLPDPGQFAALLSRYGVGRDSQVVAYDDSRQAGGARLWWLMRALGYRAPRLLNGGYAAFLQAGGQPEQTVPARPGAAQPYAAKPGMVEPDAAQPADTQFSGYCDIEALRALQADNALLVDSREERRYLGLEEPIDPVAGHIPGAINRPWVNVTDEQGRVRDAATLQQHWGDAFDANDLVVYCGSGVTACVNLFSLALLGREDAVLYAGSWSDWCSHLPS
ncbi:MAG: sulfurtransferase [Pseudomonadota bacterium]